MQVLYFSAVVSIFAPRPPQPSVDAHVLAAPGGPVPGGRAGESGRHLPPSRPAARPPPAGPPPAGTPATVGAAARWRATTQGSTGFPLPARRAPPSHTNARWTTGSPKAWRP